jgi:hypothetical protein
MVPLSSLRALLETLLEIDRIAKARPVHLS